MKKWVQIFLVVVCAFCLLAGCGGQNNSDQQDTEVAEWFEIEPDAGVLTVRIPSSVQQGYQWSQHVNTPDCLELLTMEETEETFVASFRALADGKGQITFSYAKDNGLQEIRVVEVTCKDGKITEILSANIMDTGLLPEDDQTVKELREANQISMLMRDHQAVTCVSECWDGENNWQNKTVRQFVSTNGRLWYDYEQYDDADDVVYCEAGYVNDDTPGAIYTWEKDGLQTATLCMASEYEALLSDYWLPRMQGDYELVQSTEDNKEYQNRTITVRRENFTTGVSADVLYFVDIESGLIMGMEVTEYNPEDGSIASVTRSNMLYDEPRLMEERAAMQILQAENGCQVTLVVNPGQENEETQVLQLSRQAMVEFDALEPYALFSDAACTQPMDWIDVNQDALTVYVLPDITQ